MTTAANVTLIPVKRDILAGSSSGVITKVAAYCRVSTEQENQQNSYATQISYYTDYITRNPDWQLVGIYADEGISGTRTKNRTQFNKMIRAARRKKIDLILCKSISRFARNTVDCLDYVRELKALGVTVIFEKENINTSSMSSEFAILVLISKTHSHRYCIFHFYRLAIMLARIPFRHRLHYTNTLSIKQWMNRFYYLEMKIQIYNYKSKK